MTAPLPSEIKCLQKKHCVVLQYEDMTVEFPCAFLRAHSPSAVSTQELATQSAEQIKAVNVVGVEPVGHYAIKFVFDDGHDTGIYSWQLLYELAEKQIGKSRQ